MGIKARLIILARIIRILGGKTMAEVERYAKEIAELTSFAHDFVKRVNNSCGGSFDWAAQEVIKSYLSLYDRFCPYKIGDRVQLIKPVNPKEDSGWFSCRHFLLKGSKATVVARGYSNGRFYFDVIFDAESWIDSMGEEHFYEDGRKHHFHFSEDWLTSCQ